MRGVRERFRSSGASLTPTNQGDLQHVSAEVGQEDLHHAQVHVQRLKPRPGDRRQQEVVQDKGGADAERAGRLLRQPAVQEEEQVEEEERGAELDQDLSWDVPPKFPEQEHPVRLLLAPKDEAAAAQRISLE